MQGGRFESQYTPLLKTPPAQHAAVPPLRLPQPVPPQVPQDAAQQASPLAMPVEQVGSVVLPVPPLPPEPLVPQELLEPPELPEPPLITHGGEFTSHERPRSNTLEVQQAAAPPGR
jgi:hypothetical protein